MKAIAVKSHLQGNFGSHTQGQQHPNLWSNVSHNLKTLHCEWFTKEAELLSGDWTAII